MSRKLIFLLLLINSTILHAQNFTISGYLRDEASGETLIGATVLDLESKKGAVANTHGFYSLTLPRDTVHLEFSYVGYQTITKKFILSRDTTFNIKLVGSTELEGSTVVASRNELGVRGTQMSAIEVPIVQIKNIPALGGEIDVIKALQLLPGVQSGSEGATGLYVRGGGPDQNLILLDGVPLYNINHMFGFFSVFNVDAIKNVTLYKGNFPARFGSRLSSVVDVRQNEGNENEYHGSVSIGLLSSKINLEGPIIKGKTTFNVSARRTYFDILAQPLIALANEGDGQANAGYYFYDINTKVTHKFSNKDKLTTSFYMGDDAIYVRTKDKGYDNPNEYTKSKFGWNWGNLLGAASWAHQFSNTLFSNLTLSYTRYRYKVGIGNEQRMEAENGDTGKTEYMDSETSIDYRSNIEDISALYEFDYNPHPNHAIKFGANYVYHRFVPEVGTFTYEGPETDIDDEDFIFSTLSGGESINTHEAAVYFEDNWTINDIFKFNMGLRASMYAVQEKIYPSLEPRLGFRALLTDDMSIKASYSYMSQYIHLLSNSNITLPTDLWVPVTANIKPMKSHQAALGLFYNLFDIVNLSVEGYYKHMNNIIEYKDGASFFASTKGWETKVNMGEGWSYGVEFLVEKKIGKLTGWIGYTWSKSERKFDREGMEINDGKPFYAKYDRRHDISVVAQYKFSKKFDIAATFIYGTGARATMGSQVYTDPNDDYMIYEYIPQRNSFKLPDYMRFDIGMNFYKKRKKGESIWNISIYNLTNRHNPFFVFNDGEVLQQMSIFPILPSVSYTYRF